MNSLSKEVNLIQNPALGAVIIWSMICGYKEEKDQDLPIALSMLSIPIVFYRPLLDVISRTQKKSGLRKFVSKLTETKNGASTTDLLLSIQERTRLWKDVSLTSLKFALASNLITFSDHACISTSINNDPPAKYLTGISRIMLKGARKLGLWFSPLSLEEIEKLLHLRF